MHFVRLFYLYLGYMFEICLDTYFEVCICSAKIKKHVFGLSLDIPRKSNHAGLHTANARVFM
jgi:hypothetical protein